MLFFFCFQVVRNIAMLSCFAADSPEEILAACNTEDGWTEFFRVWKE